MKGLIGGVTATEFSSRRHSHERMRMAEVVSSIQTGITAAIGLNAGNQSNFTVISMCRLPLLEAHPRLYCQRPLSHQDSGSVMRWRWIILLSLCLPSYATDIYFAPSAQGAANGTDCADAYLITDITHGINVAGNWVAGNTLHLCLGTYSFSGGSAYISSQGAGSTGNPITLKLETGAVLQARPITEQCFYWRNQYHSQLLVTVDGGTNRTFGRNAQRHNWRIVSGWSM